MYNRIMDYNLDIAKIINSDKHKEFYEDVEKEILGRGIKKIIRFLLKQSGRQKENNDEKQSKKSLDRSFITMKHTDYNSLPWTRKKYASYIRFNDYDESQSNKAQGLIGKAVDILKGFQEDNPFVSGFISILLKISSILVGLKALFVGLSTPLESWAAERYRQIGKAEEMIEKLNAETEKLSGKLSEFQKFKNKLSFNPKYIVLVGILRTLLLILTAYTAKCAADILSYKREYEKRK